MRLSRARYLLILHYTSAAYISRLGGVFILPVNNYATQLCYVCAEKYREFYKNKPGTFGSLCWKFYFKGMFTFQLPTVLKVMLAEIVSLNIF